MFKFIPRLKPYYTASDWMAAFNVFKRNPIKKYEDEFANKFENKYGVMFQHGRTGLYALLESWDLNNNEVICPAYTCVVVPNAIVLSGNIPVFVDSASNSFNMDISLLERTITKKTRAIIVTHIFGYPMDVIKIQAMVQKAEEKYGHKIYIIQDAAHSYGAKWKGELITKFGDASIFGSNISKIINSIFGGMVITNSQETYDDLMRWRIENIQPANPLKSIKRLMYFIAVSIAFNSYIYGFVNWLERLGALDKFVKYFDEDQIYFPKDWDHSPSNIEARIGLNQLKKYDYIIEERVKNAQSWMKKLEQEDIEFKNSPEGATYSHCVACVENREEWLEKYRKQGIQLGILIEYSVPYMIAYKNYKADEYPMSLYYSKNTVNFPNWPR
jgi:perosamine synthetase